MKFLRDLKPEEINGKRFLVRLDLNVPVENNVVQDDFRIVSSLPTLNFIKDNGGSIVVIAHCEANKGESCSLDAATAELKKHIADLPAQAGIEVKPNLRENAGEKTNDPAFAQELASLGDMYVNDAFSVSHREHASLVGVPKLLPSYAGFQLEKEIKNLEKSFNPTHPFVFILGGAKFETKIPLIEKFLDKADTIFIGGALANDLLKASGTDVKNSLVSKEAPDLSKYVNHPKIIPVTGMVWDNDSIVDIGSETIEKLCEKIQEAKFVVWNGPLGYTEKGFDAATLRVAQAITESSAESIIGGGDTLSALKDSGYLDKFTFVSTGGGATLDFLANGTLPGIEALG
jgi:phosphoglycerate kinase